MTRSYQNGIAAIICLVFNAGLASSADDFYGPCLGLAIAW